MGMVAGEDGHEGPQDRYTCGSGRTWKQRQGA
jgi:hypothetical protein